MTASRAIVLTIGDELLLGRTIDTNATWLADRLALLGLPVARMESLPDDAATIAEAIESAAAEAALVVTTGGLGPTEDDRTVAGVKKAVGDGAREIENPRGVEPGLWYPPVTDAAGAARGALLVLPGPPREMTAVFEEAVDLIGTSLGDRQRPVYTRTIATTGIPEVRLAPLLQPRIDGVEAVEIAFLPDLLGVDLRLTVRDEEAEVAMRLLDAAEAEIAEIIAPYQVAAPSGDTVEALTDALLARRWTVAVAESCTGGGIGERITSRGGASRVFHGGVIAYVNEAKERLLGVPHELLVEHGAVSEPVAAAMARGAARALDADCGIGISGIAGPGGGTDAKPVGTVCYAASTPETSVVTTRVFSGDREAVRRRSGQAAIVQLLRLVEEGA